MPTIDLPWAAWYSDSRHSLRLPEHWSVDVLEPLDAPACSGEEIATALESPIESEPLRDLAKQCKSACIAVDDLARPTMAADVLPFVLGQLHEAGLTVDAIRIVIATGSHGALTREQLGWKVGAETLARYPVECHDCRADLAGTGIPYGDEELKVNRTFYEAEVKIVIGSVLPHSFAGHSGGAKLVIPGLSDLRATARSHKFVQLGLRGGVDPDKNRFRTEIEELARRLGLQFGISIVTNAYRQSVAVFAGDFVAAHRRACGVAKELYRTDVRSDYDCVVLNAYPKDTELVQAENALVALKTGPKKGDSPHLCAAPAGPFRQMGTEEKGDSPHLCAAPAGPFRQMGTVPFSRARSLVREHGLIVLTTAASEGMGRHGLFEPGGFSYHPPRPMRAVAGQELWIYAPAVSTEIVRKLYWEGYPVFHDATALERALADRLPGPTAAAVFPCAPMQQIHDLRTAPVTV